MGGGGAGDDHLGRGGAGDGGGIIIVNNLKAYNSIAVRRDEVVADFHAAMQQQADSVQKLDQHHGTIQTIQVASVRYLCSAMVVEGELGTFTSRALRLCSATVVEGGPPAIAS